MWLEGRAARRLEAWAGREVDGRRYHVNFCHVAVLLGIGCQLLLLNGAPPFHAVHAQDTPGEPTGLLPPELIPKLNPIVVSVKKVRRGGCWVPHVMPEGALAHASLALTCRAPAA